MSETNDVGKYKGKFLLEEPPLMLQPTLAQMVGQNEAQFLQLVHYLSHNPFYDQHLNAKVEIKVHEGRLWVKIPPILLLDKRRGRLKFMSESTWKRTVASCKNLHVLFTADLNDDKRDNTNWYSLDLEEMVRQEAEHIQKIEREYSVGFAQENDAQSADGGQCQNDTVAGSDSSQCQNEPVGSVKMTPCDSVKMTPCDSVKMTPCTERKEKRRKQQQQKQKATFVADVVDEDFSNLEAASIASSDSNAEALTQQLIELKVSQKVARRLVGEIPDMVAAQITWWPWRKNEVRSFGPGTLISCIENGWPKPQSLQNHEDALDARERAARQAEERDDRDRARQAETAAQEAQLEGERAELEIEYSKLDVKSQREIDDEASRTLGFMGESVSFDSPRWKMAKAGALRAWLERRANRVLENRVEEIKTTRDESIASQARASLAASEKAEDDPLKKFALDTKAQDRVLDGLANGQMKKFDERLQKVAAVMGLNPETCKPQLQQSLRRRAVVELASEGVIQI